MRVFSDLQSLPTFRNAVITIGSFDGVHLGHQRILQKVQSLARAHGGESVVVTFDPHPRTVLRPDDASFKLLSTTAEKIALLEAFGADNVVVVPFTLDFARLSAQAYVEDFLLKKFRPRCIVIGYDHHFGANREGDISFLKKFEKQAGFELVEIPAQEVDEIAVSSSKIRKALESADLALANRLLGHPFSFSGQVVKGDQIGRTIGFPTANIALNDPHKLLLPQGIYAARVKDNPTPGPSPEGRGVGGASRTADASVSAAPLPSGEGLSAALYIGDRPTLQPLGNQVIEVNIFDFDGDLYGQNLTVEVMDFIRSDRKFDGLESLQRQIAEDKAEIQRRLSAPSVAIVILNYNTRRHLAQFLPSVIAHSAGARIIVADNGSPDDSIDFLRAHYPDVEVIDLARNYGFAEGYNQALKRVQAEVYVILNSDVEVTPGWLDPALGALRADFSLAVVQPKILAWQASKNEVSRFEHAGAAGGWMDALGYPFCRGRIFSQREEDRGQYDTGQECFWAAGAAFFIRAKLYHAFGGFDGDYFAHNEEIDLCWRLKRAGYSVRCEPQSVVYHLGGGTLEYENPRKVFLNFRNSLYSLLKNEPWAKLFWLIPARFLLDGLAGARFAAKGQFPAIWAIVRAHFSFYNNFGKTLSKRRFATQIIEKQRIKPENRAGIFSGSIIVAHYFGRVKRFSKLWKKEP
jgi:hypothetical protein